MAWCILYEYRCILYIMYGMVRVFLKKDELKELVILPVIYRKAEFLILSLISATILTITPFSSVPNLVMLTS